MENEGKEQTFFMYSRVGGSSLPFRHEYTQLIGFLEGTKTLLFNSLKTNHHINKRKKTKGNMKGFL